MAASFPSGAASLRDGTDALIAPASSDPRSSPGPLLADAPTTDGAPGPSNASSDPDADDDAGPGFNGFLIGVSISLSIGLTILAICIAVVRRWRRKRRSNQADHSQEGKNRGAGLPAAPKTSAAMLPAVAETQALHGQWTGVGAGMLTIHTTGVTTTFGQPPSTVFNTEVATAETTFAQQKERLTKELDSMRARGEHFLGQFSVLSWTERREGGQGVVQFMRSTRTDEAVAVKFFLLSSAYDTEVQLYKVQVLRSMMPVIKMEVRNGNGAERNSHGYPWPPCIVLEKGESLQEWKAKTQPAFSTIVDALCLIVQRLTTLHGSGWVHRDLKPGNVLRLPGQHSWTLMDFGCAAHEGTDVRLTFSPSYAPPEVALAAERGAHTIVADAAADMWALGLMAFELLTGKSVFPPMASTREGIWAQLCGRALLPWEAGAPQQSTDLAKLGVLKRAILQCLQRRPEDRPTAEKVLMHWRNLFESSTTTPQPL